MLIQSTVSGPRCRGCAGTHPNEAGYASHLAAAYYNGYEDECADSEHPAADLPSAAPLDLAHPPPVSRYEQAAAAQPDPGWSPFEYSDEGLQRRLPPRLSGNHRCCRMAPLCLGCWPPWSMMTCEEVISCNACCDHPILYIIISACTNIICSPVFSHITASRSADLGHLSRMEGQINHPSDVPVTYNQRATDFRPGNESCGYSVFLVLDALCVIGTPGILPFTKSRMRLVCTPKHVIRFSGCGRRMALRMPLNVY